MRQINRIERKIVRKDKEIEKIMIDRNEIENKVNELKMQQNVQRDNTRDKIETLSFRIEQQQAKLKKVEVDNDQIQHRVELRQRERQNQEDLIR
jgi:stress response protein SCP2